MRETNLVISLNQFICFLVVEYDSNLFISISWRYSVTLSQTEYFIFSLHDRYLVRSSWILMTSEAVVVSEDDTDKLQLHLKETRIYESLPL